MEIETIKSLTNGEIEVIVFGPGFGESILIHYGNNNWIVVDSGINPFTKKIFPLEYFEIVGIDPVSSVKLIIATHWHDDHIKGLSKIVEVSRNAEFVCSVALTKIEFAELIEAYKDIYVSNNNGISEFSSILSLYKNSNKSLTFAIDDKLLFSDANTSIYSLSPSSESVIKAIASIASLLPKKYTKVISVKDINPNYTSVVLWIKINDLIILLGADLEETSDPKTGWSAILQCRVINSKASIFKVPHHGSRNGHSQDVWDKMVIKNVHSAVTPFIWGRNRLPTQEDIERICSLTPNAYSTSNKISSIRRPEVDKFLKQMNKKIYKTFPEPSFIRFKYKFSTRIETSLSGGAYKICSN